MTDNRTYREKALYHLHRAEAWQLVVDDLEQKAEKAAQVRVAAERSRFRARNPVPLGYAVKIELKDDWRYAQATSNRNAHQVQATMYAAMATMEGQ